MIKNYSFLSLRISQAIFLLLIFLLPTQLGKHFWPSWSLVNGVRIDYLAPTVYVTDILILILFIFSVGARFPRPYILLLLAPILLSNFSPLSLIKTIKIIEILIFAYLVKIHLNKQTRPQFIFVFSLSLLFQSGLAIAQFFNRGSLNGIFYWFGERSFSGTTIGIANASINGQLILRPYGTFPHPNVLAGFLLLGIVLITNFVETQHAASHEKDLPAQSVLKKLADVLSRDETLHATSLRNNLFFWLIIVLSSFALFLTMSRVAIGLMILFFLFYFIRRGGFVTRPMGRVGRPSPTEIILMALIVLSAFYILSPRYFSIFGEDKQSFETRFSQSQIALAMWRDHPFFGVGLNQYLVSLPKYVKITSFKDYQPVHNLFLLILAETGIFGFLLFLFLTFKLLFFNFKFGIILIFLILLLFDHYFYTIQQGNLMLGLILGLVL